MKYHFDHNYWRTNWHAPLKLLLLLTVWIYAGQARASDSVESAGQSQALVTRQDVSTPGTGPGAPVPNFNAYQNVREKKSAFFEFMNTKVKIANNEVWAQRCYLLQLREKLAVVALTAEENRKLSTLGNSYKLATSAQLDRVYVEKLLRRVDIVPTSLVLAQAANESAWGTSRFAREGRNFFGTWCFEAGCGIPPKHRKKGTQHEVNQFESVQDGVRHYIHYLNSSNMYPRFRSLRATAREGDVNPRGENLAEGLTAYSARGKEYVKEIKAIIRQNKLIRYSVERKVTPVLTAQSQ